MAELIACPDCKKHLQVPEDLLGKTVQCPECKHTFTAALPGAPESVTQTVPSKPAGPAEWDKKISSATGKRRKGNDENDTREDGDGYSVEKRDEDDDDDDRDHDDDEPRRRRRRRRSSSGGYYAPHRGGLILAFGIIALVGHAVVPLAPFIFGILAWVMGNADMAEIQAGRMDPEGEGMTQAGRIMGMIATIIGLIGLVAGCGLGACWFLAVMGMIGAGAAANQGQRRR